MTTFLGVRSSDVCEWDTKASATDPGRSYRALGVGSAVPSGRAGGCGWIRAVASRARLGRHRRSRGRGSCREDVAQHSE